MATRWYFGVDTPTFETYQMIDFPVKMEARTSVQTPSSAAQAVTTGSEVSTTDAIIYGFIGATKPLAAQTLLAGTTFTCRVLCIESAAAMNASLCCYIKLHASGQQSPKGQYFASYVSTTEYPNNSDYTNISLLTNRTCSYTFPSNVTIAEGDFFTFGLSSGCQNTKTTQYFASMAYGYHSGDSDAPANETATDGAAYNPWVELSQTLNFSTAGATTWERNPYENVGPTDARLVHLSRIDGLAADVGGISDALTKILSRVRFPADNAGVTDYAKILHILQQDWEINPYSVAGIIDMIAVRHMGMQGNNPAEDFEIFDYPERKVLFRRLIQ